MCEWWLGVGVGLVSGMCGVGWWYGCGLLCVGEVVWVGWGVCGGFVWVVCLRGGEVCVCVNMDALQHQHYHVRGQRRM